MTLKELKMEQNIKESERICEKLTVLRHQSGRRLFYGIYEKVPFAMAWHLRNPVTMGQVKSLLVSDPGQFRGSIAL